ncbi:hypothetical protein ZYGR_0N06590 [Zygosaccharomyces rouxii]|uniref:ZYRO0D15444p n=2 Tax=Zygosaccharomyces rouxii TaxID=4956 RepID=C5DWJ9_ZYGRC|nr:uncharacterized protein ZYRO0D15444g [Zygosaccharomyces rouxii]KAH9201078.1 hypothetical protein LQ764DRAFT_103254 [Zygosaccharomyces rouxii]GAV49252.1 hypothetical protein ZYGR_0N06590 [Zygosaccharomyces rouxii]CAR28168.1 ZYRO0D15444p [Zygosaccharomyces rouxii]
MQLTNKSSEEQTDTRETVDEDSTNEIKDTTQDEVKRNRIKLITKLLIDSKYSLMDDVNYNRGFSELKDKSVLKESHLDPVISESNSSVSLDKSNANKNNNNHKNNKNVKNFGITIPRSTRIKADRVRIYLDNYYTKMEGSISIENSEHLHEGIEGVYNPLQVIRNRKLKNKYNEMPARQFSMRKPPLIAVLEFSRKPHKRMPWFVDVTEISSDMTWRTSHWDELVDPHGNLWFGKKDTSSHIEGPYNKSRHESRSSQKKNQNHHHHHHHHHHLRRPYHRSRSSRRESGAGLPDYGSTTDDGDVNGTPMENTKLLKSYNELDVNDKDINHLTPEEYADEESLNAASERSRLNRFEMMIKKPRWSKSPNSRRKSHGTSVDKLTTPIHHTRTGSTATTRATRPSRGSASSGLVSNISTTPQANNSIASNSTDSQMPRNNLLNAVAIHRLRTPGAEVAVDDDDEEDAQEIDPLQEKPFEPVKSSENFEYGQVDEKLQEHRYSTRFLLSAMKVVKHRKMTDAIIKKKYIQKRCTPQHDENMPLIVNSTSEMLKTYDEELERALKKGNNYASSLLNDYSMCVETLISTTDRILSDINTTLTLKLKMFQENADRFGTLKMMKTQKLTKILYGVLEFTIITVFWTIWLAVSIVKCTKLSLVLTVKLLKWMLW